MDIEKKFKKILEELKEDIKKEEKDAKTWFTNQGKTPETRHEQWVNAEFHNGGLREAISKIDKLINKL